VHLIEAVAFKQRSWELVAKASWACMPQGPA